MRQFTSRLRARRGRCAVRVLFIIIVMGVVVWRGVRSRRGTNDTATRAGAAAQVAQPKYVPAGDEGLGAAIAIMVDNSGSMENVARDDDRPKYRVARQALEQMLATTDAFIERQPDFPIKVGLFYFSTGVHSLVPIAPYDKAALRAGLNAIPFPNGGTAIGDAMDEARDALYKSGIIRKYILVVTDGENTAGRLPSDVAKEIAERSEGAIRQYFVAFDIDADKFSFVRDVKGEVLGANNGRALRASLDTIYRGRILAEAMDAGETLPPPARPTGSTTRRDSAAKPVKQP